MIIVSVVYKNFALTLIFFLPHGRAAFLAFCNHSESRRIFIHLTSSEDRGEGQIHVGTSPPKTLSDKSLFFLKCSHASKLSRESISEDVVYSECSKVPLGECVEARRIVQCIP